MRDLRIAFLTSNSPFPLFPPVSPVLDRFGPLAVRPFAAAGTKGGCCAAGRDRRVLADAAEERQRLALPDEPALR